jgi:hypothetical protein
MSCSGTILCSPSRRMRSRSLGKRRSISSRRSVLTRLVPSSCWRIRPASRSTRQCRLTADFARGRSNEVQERSGRPSSEATMVSRTGSHRADMIAKRSSSSSAGCSSGDELRLAITTIVPWCFHGFRSQQDVAWRRSARRRDAYSAGRAGLMTFTGCDCSADSTYAMFMIW